MKLTTSTLNKQDIKKLAAVADVRNPLPILSCLLLTAAEGTLTLSANNLETFMSFNVTADITVEGRATVDAKKFQQIIESLDTKEVVSIEMDTKKLAIRQGAAKFSLPSLSADDYPVWDLTESTNSVIMGAPDLSVMLKSVMFAASSEDFRFNLCSVYLDKTKMVATDGHRMALTETPFNFSESVILPKEFVANLAKYIEKSQDNFDFSFSEKTATLKGQSGVVSGRLINGDFPDYNRVIPDSYAQQVTVNVAALTNCVKRIIPLTSAINKGVSLNFDPTSESLTVSFVGPDIGEGSDSVPIKGLTDPLSVTMNAKYILDALGAITTENVILRLGVDMKPIIFIPEGVDGCFSLIMPMRR